MAAGVPEPVTLRVGEGAGVALCVGDGEGEAPLEGVGVGVARTSTSLTATEKAWPVCKIVGSATTRAEVETKSMVEAARKLVAAAAARAGGRAIPSIREERGGVVERRLPAPPFKVSVGAMASVEPSSSSTDTTVTEEAVKPSPVMLAASVRTARAVAGEREERGRERRTERTVDTKGGR
jgi:hypothetical protein